jgi:hypothetical protein
VSAVNWINKPAVFDMDSLAAHLLDAVQGSRAVVIRGPDAGYYVYLSKDLRIKPWFARLRRMKQGRVADYLDVTGQMPALIIQAGEEPPQGVSHVLEMDPGGSPSRVAFQAVVVNPEINFDGEIKSVPVDLVDEGPASGDAATSSITRYPSLTTSKPLEPGRHAQFTMDLTTQPPSGEADPDVVTIRGLPGNWKQVAISMEMASAHVVFTPSTGSILLKRDGSSIPCILKGTVSADCEMGQLISVVTTFLIDGRVCGFVRNSFKLGEGPSRGHASPVDVDLNATPPVLTISIFQVDPDRPGRLLWSLTTPNSEIPGMPQKLNDTVDLGTDPASFVRALYTQMPQLEAGKHVAIVRGFGETLWRKAPDFFQKAYWATRRTFGEKFAIQFISTDPNIPWELMRPLSENEDIETDILAMTHPVARCLGDSYGSLRRRLPGGKIVTIAPKYPSPNDTLERAQIETQMLQSRYGAVPVAGTRNGMWTLLTKGLDAETVSILHFAGHGEFPLDRPALSSVQLEDGNLTVIEVATQEVKLGKRSGCLIIFNACKTASTGSALGGVGGWAQTVLQQRFGGFVAPLWAVEDEAAAVVGADLFEALVKRRTTVAQALLSIRQSYGARSPTYLAYLFYGDVHAGIGA